MTKSKPVSSPTPHTLLVYTQVVDETHPILGFFCGWLREFAGHFDEVHVIAMQVGEHDLPDNVTVHTLGKERGYSKLRQLWRFYRHFARLQFSKRPDYVFFHMGAIFTLLAAPFFLVRKLTGTTFFWWKTHGLVDSKARLALQFVDRVYTGSDQSFRLHTPKKFVIGHAIDTDLFSQRVHSETCSSIVMVGRVVSIKKIEVGIAAFHNAILQSNNLTLEIIGPIVAEEYYKTLEHQIEQLELTDKVTFYGPVSQRELQQRLQQSCILLHPSYEAGLDKAVLESMLSGVIPLTSIPSYESMLSPYGLFIQANDTEVYGRKINELCDLSLLKREKLAAQLRQEVVTHHSLSTLSQRLFANSVD